MKKTIVLALALLICLAGCAKAPEPQTLAAKVIEVYDGTALAAAEGGGLYTFPFVGDGLEITGGALAAGSSAEITYTGDIAESYPIQLGGVTNIAVSDSASGDLAGLYFRVIGDLWRDGEGMTEGIELIALDLSQAANLTEGEKEALCYLTQFRYGLEVVESTADELREGGYIEEGLYFPSGVLISFSRMSFEQDSFAFNATIWRSGLAAILYTDCTATLADGAWGYAVGGWGIA